MILRLWIVLVVALFSLLAYQFWQNQLLKKASLSVCNQVFTKFYQPSKHLDDWHKDCLQKANSIPYMWSKTQTVRWLQAKVASLGGSHVDLWTPDEMSRMWEGEDKDIGIHVEQVKGHFIITEVYSSGPAALKLKKGDEILFINQKVPVSSWQAMNTQGDFLILRKTNEERYFIKKEPMRFPFDASLKKIKKRLGLLSLKSFAPIYYNEGGWQEIKKNMEFFDKIVIDLRDNTGGDFVIMLQYLSHFFCDARDIGYLIQPRKKKKEVAVFEEYMDGETQIEMVERSSVVELRTFHKKSCYSGEVNVLVNEDTASTAEIFAEAIRLRRGTKILGQSSSGAVLLAIWYPTLFGKDYSLSVPVANYLNWQDQEIEGVGVQPNKRLEYDLEMLREGKDNWILEAANY